MGREEGGVGGGSCLFAFLCTELFAVIDVFVLEVSQRGCSLYLNSVQSAELSFYVTR